MKISEEAALKGASSDARADQPAAGSTFRCRCLLCVAPVEANVF